MNFYSLIGFILAAIVLSVGLRTSADDPNIFFDKISAFIVFGGTLSSTAICFQLNKIFLLLKVFIRRILVGRLVDYSDTIRELMTIADLYKNNLPKLSKSLSTIKDPFLKEGMVMVIDGVIHEGRIVNILRSRVDSLHSHYSNDAMKFKTISKFPPAFGMMGTTMGMIVLLSKLSGLDAAKSIGPAMSICLITTLYGVVLANMLIIPISENLAASSREIKLKNLLIVEGIRLILKKENPVVLAEVLNSYLMPSDRIDWRKASKG